MGALYIEMYVKLGRWLWINKGEFTAPGETTVLTCLWDGLQLKGSWRSFPSWRTAARRSGWTSGLTPAALA